MGFLKKNLKVKKKPIRFHIYVEPNSEDLQILELNSMEEKNLIDKRFERILKNLDERLKKEKNSEFAEYLIELYLGEFIPDDFKDKEKINRLNLKFGGLL